MPKSADAFRTIREVADWLGVPTHVLRFWESKFDSVKPVKGPGGRRYYRPDDMRLLGGIRVLLHEQGMTIRGVQKMIKDSGLSVIEALSPEPSFENVAPPRVRRRPARSVAIDANAGGTGLGGIYDLDALADGVKDPGGADEAPMIHVDTPDLEAEVVAFTDALSEPEGAAPAPEEPEPEVVAPEPEVEAPVLTLTDPIPPEPTLAEPTLAEPTLAEPTTPEHTTPEQTTPEPTTPDMFDPVVEDVAEDDGALADSAFEDSAFESVQDTVPVQDAEIAPQAEPEFARDAPRPVDQLPEVAPNDPSLQPEHVMARALTEKARASRDIKRALNVAERARLGIVTRRLRTLAVRLAQEVQD